MGFRYENWVPRMETSPSSCFDIKQMLEDRFHLDQDITLNYGDYGLFSIKEVIHEAILKERKIALYADYDVDGTMSCVSWVWFFEAIGYKNYTYYIPDRFKEGYGLNLEAVKRLVYEENAELIITMDCGITANTEASWCREQGVQFICTDHHKINPANVPDAFILNPITHPDPEYQFLCGCGITYVLLRKLGEEFSCKPALWYDLLALAGLATICDMVPLNSVNHKLAKLGMKALAVSSRPTLVELLKQAREQESGPVDEQMLGFKIGPRINAVGRLDHAGKIVRAFLGDGTSDLIKYMSTCNEERKKIQDEILVEAFSLAYAQKEQPILFVGGDWHIGVIGIVAARLAETFWKPVWIYSTSQTPIFKGSVRSIPGFDVASAMMSCGELFLKYGGHAAAAGFTFEVSKKEEILSAIVAYASLSQKEKPFLWRSQVTYDFSLDLSLFDLSLLDVLDHLRPFGREFPEPVFKVHGILKKISFYNDKITGEKKHTCILLQSNRFQVFKILFFNNVYEDIQENSLAEVLVTAQKNYWRSRVSLSLIGVDISISSFVSIKDQEKLF